MFFNLILLNRQHKAHFGIAWVAGLRGVQHVNKKNVLELNIGKLCDDIAEYVCSESDSPRSRFSLRLSAILINGTIKLYKQKATYLLDDLVKVLTVFTTPAIISRYNLTDI
ncbi:unnamed protein product [Tenebrio molitor]|nr:unnamed protein product [Tenebrio molitor]